MPFCQIVLTGRKRLTIKLVAEPVTIGDHLKNRRLRLGQHQKTVAKLLGTSEASVWNWENNQTSPTLPFIPRIIKYLGYAPFETGSQSLGDRIVAARRRLGWTQKRLARELGVDPTTLGYWERGERRPSEANLEKIRMLLDP